MRGLGGLWESVQANHGDISPNCMRGEFLPAQAPHCWGWGCGWLWRIKRPPGHVVGVILFCHLCVNFLFHKSLQTCLIDLHCSLDRVAGISPPFSGDTASQASADSQYLRFPLKWS